MRVHVYICIIGKERKEPNAMKNNSEYESDVTNNLELQNVSATISAEGHTSAIITNLSGNFRIIINCFTYYRCENCGMC